MVGKNKISLRFSSVQFSRSVVSDSLRPHEQPHARPPCPSPTPGVHPNPYLLSWLCYPTILSSVIPFSFCPQSLPASESFPMSQLFAWGVQSTGASALASFLPKKSQGSSPSEWNGWISLKSKGPSRVFSNTTVQKHQFFGTLLSLWSKITISPVQFSRSVVSDSLRPHESQHARPPCPSPTPGVHSNSRLSSQWCHPAISSSVVPFSSCPQSLPASESFPMSQLFAWGVQSTGASALASFLPKKSQGWSPSEWTGWISLQWEAIFIQCIQS